MAQKPNFASETIWTADNLPVMRGMNSASVDLIYLDPPFNSNANYAAPIGSKAAGAEFKDTWGLSDISLAWHGEIKHEYPGLYDLLNATRAIHGDSMMSYLIYMAIRIMEMRRVLKDTGSIYLHCDPTAAHYLKLLMDSIFGRNGFRNEIIWHYQTGGNSKRLYAKKHDTLFFYTVSGDYAFNPKAIPFQRTEKSLLRAQNPVGARIGAGDKTKLPLDVWTDIQALNPMAKERTGYPTQKPLALLQRIVRASSDEGGTVLDPFCGCATACVAAQMEGRKWAGIDISSKAADLVKDRMKNELGMFFKGVHRTDIPERTDLGKVLKYNHKENIKDLYGQQGGYCNGCQIHFERQNLTVDHIIPSSKGGTDHFSNLQLLCNNCNSIKGDRPHEYLLACLTDKGFIKRQKGG